VKLSKELKAGLIVIVAIVAFVLLFQFMKGKNIFSTENTFFIKYDNVQGLAKSSPVSINGLNVGKVEDIRPITTKDGHVYFVVEVNVNEDFVFSKDSPVEIFSPGIMDDKALKINLVYTGPKAQDGDTLRGEMKLSAISQITDQLGPVSERITSVLSRVDTLAGSTNKLLDEQNRREIRELLANLNATTQAFKITAEQAGKLISSNQEQVKEVLNNTNEAIKSYGKVADNIDAQKLNDAIAKLSQTSEELNKVITGINEGKGSLGKLLSDDELYNNLNKSAASLDALISDLKEHPNRYVNFSVFGKSSK